MSESHFDFAKRVMADDWIALRLLAKEREVERLRELLEKTLVYSHSMPTTLVAAIEKEVGDE